MPRPAAVTALAALSIVLGVLTVALVGIRFLMGSSFGFSLGFLSGLAKAVGWNNAGIVLLGFLTTAIGFGMFYGRKYFWYFSLVFWISDIVLTLIFSVAFAFVDVMFWLELAFVAYLLRFDVQQYFRVNIRWRW